MKSKIKEVLKKAFSKYLHYYRAIKIIIDNKSYLHTTGWMKSLEDNKPVDIDGNVVPWINYPTIKFLQDRLRKDFHLFEFGSGYSTLFYARLVQSVISVEHDESWFQFIKKNAPENVELIYKQIDVDAEYCRTIKLVDRKYDVVAVDGRDRVNCIKQSIASLSDRGIILLDDAERAKYMDGVNYLMKDGFRTIFFEGLKPASNRKFRTTIFYRSDNCLGI